MWLKTQYDLMGDIRMLILDPYNVSSTLTINKHIKERCILCRDCLKWYCIVCCVFFSLFIVSQLAMQFRLVSQSNTN